MPEIDLFAIQPYVDGYTFRSEERYRRAMGALVERAQRLRGGSCAPALMVFPEHVGTFLFLAALGPAGPRVRSEAVATALALLARPRPFLRALRRLGRRALGGAGLERAGLLALADDVHGAYLRTFSGLARDSGATIVAGSALLPDGGDEVFNLSYTFAPTGACVSTTRKVNLVPDLEDGIGLSTGDPADLAPVDVPVGRLGTLICYDGFSVAHTHREPGWRAVGGELARRGVHVIAQPSANPWPWFGPWVHADPGEALSRREQWRCEGLADQLAGLPGVHYGVTAHLLGEVLGQRFEGRSEILRRGADGAVEVVARAERADPSPGAAEVVHARVEAPWLEDG